MKFQIKINKSKHANKNRMPNKKGSNEALKFTRTFCRAKRSRRRRERIDISHSAKITQVLFPINSSSNRSGHIK